MDLSKISLAEHLQNKKDEFADKIKDAQKTIQPELLEFLVNLGMEGERSAVVLGAERINVSVENLLKCFLRPSAGKKDALFASQGALAAFSKKIEMAYRIGLIDLKMRQAIDMVRNLRNDFAHATTVETLQDQKHSDRVQALWKLMMNGNKNALEGFDDCFRDAAKQVGAKLGKQTACYLSCIMAILIKLELARYHVEPPFIVLPVKVNFDDPD